jgi:hypothetical protein
MRIPLVRCLGWAVFAALLVSLGATLYQVLLRQPRWQVHLEADERVVLVEGVHGRIFIHDNKGVTALDLFTGRRLGLVFAGTDFTYSNLDGFSPDHRYYPVRFDNGRQLAVVDVVTLQAKQIDLRGPEDNDRFPDIVFSPGSEWLVARVRDENHRLVKEVAAEAATGKVVFQTEPGISFGPFVPEGKLIIYERSAGRTRQDAASVWDLATGKKVHDLPPFLAGSLSGRDDCCPRAWSADGRILIACRESAEGTPELVAWDVLNNRLQARVPAEIAAHATQARVSPDGQLVILATGPDGKRLVFFDLATGAVRKEHRLPARAEAFWFLPDGELVRDTSAGDELWDATPDPSITYRLTFAGQMGHLLLDGEFTYHFRDSRTGRVVASRPQRADFCWPPEHQFCRRMLFVRSRATGEASSAAVLRQWLPWGNRPTCQIQWIDLATGDEVGQLDFPESPQFHFAEPHGLLVSWHPQRDGHEVACWDVPLRPAWGWVLGLPLGLALALAGWRSLQRSRR